MVTVASQSAGAGMAQRVAEIQRSRLLGAAIAALEDVGLERATVAQITHRARVSRRTFYELFTNREQCIAAALERVVEQGRQDLRAAGLQGGPWSERMRLGLWGILCFLEREPTLARLLLVESARGSGPVLQVRERALAQLASEVDSGRREGSRGCDCSELTAEAVVGGALAVVQKRLVESRGRRRIELSGLLEELLMIVLLPYAGAALARREQRRPAPMRPEASRRARHASSVARDPLRNLQMRVTYRTAKVLEAVGQSAGASNRAVADHAGITDQGQISKLLGRLERLGLIENHGQGHVKGEPNAWALTATGTEVAHAIAAHIADGDHAASHMSCASPGTSTGNARRGGRSQSRFSVDQTVDEGRE